MKCGKVEKGLKHHGWGSHGGTWKMGAWGRNIVPKTLHVGGVGRGRYCFRAQTS